MKKIYYILIIMIMINFSLLIPKNVSAETIQSENMLEISEENFPDEVLREILFTEDNDGDGYLSDEEIKTIKSIDLIKGKLQDEEMGRGLQTTLTKQEKVKRYCEVNLKGIDKLTSLTAIHVGTGYYKGYERKTYNFKLLYKLPKLIGLEISGDDNINKLKLYKFKKLKNVTLSHNFDSVSFGKKSKIENLNLIYCHINKRLDISQLKRLKKFWVYRSALSNLKVGSKNRRLETFYLTAALDDLNKCKIRKLDFSNIRNLKKVEIRSWRKLKSIKFKNNNKIKKVKVGVCFKLKNIIIEKCKKAKRISKQIGLEKYTTIKN